MSYLIETKNLTKEYQKIKRVDQVNLKVRSGCIYGFLGPNGAGKSTTLKMILGLSTPTSGSIRILGKPLESKTRLSILKEVGSLIESPSYYEHLTARENLEILAALHKTPKKNIEEVLSIVRLTGQEGKKVSHYSLGMKQRLGIAMALLNFPKLLILDEPTNGLDPAGISEMRQLLLSLPKRYQMTILISSHLLSEIDQIANEIGIIANGKLIYQDRLQALHDQSHHYIIYRTNNQEKALECFHRSFYHPTLKDGCLIFSDIMDSDIPTINQILLKEHLDIYRIEEQEKNLEDLFLDLTKKAVSL